MSLELRYDQSYKIYSESTTRETVHITHSLCKKWDGIFFDKLDFPWVGESNSIDGLLILESRIDWGNSFPLNINDSVHFEVAVKDYSDDFYISLEDAEGNELHRCNEPSRSCFFITTNRSNNDPVMVQPVINGSASIYSVTVSCNRRALIQKTGNINNTPEETVPEKAMRLRKEVYGTEEVKVGIERLDEKIQQIKKKEPTTKKQETVNKNTVKKGKSTKGRKNIEDSPVSGPFADRD